MSGRTTRD
uniref:Cef1 n=1 Tax=Arundo donax TaxID=35708 RepID=A0A0A9GY21_ARUDO